ncbi:MAG: HPP family protein [Thiohalomonadales bacterium]
MTFYVQGLNSHEVMPLMQLFKQRYVEKTQKISPDHPVAAEPHEDTPQSRQSGIAMQSYHAIEQLPQGNPVLLASQVMTSPVITIKSNESIDAALTLFQTHQLRHIPVISDAGVVQGIISDRDILRHLSGVTEDYKQQKSFARINDHINQLMTSRVLTASIDTDVRYIARLFVEQRVGAMPIVVEGKLTGILTRSDLLSAIMRHFIIELWT